MAAMEKVFKCLSCGADIRLERKPDNSGWNRYELDGVTPRIDEKKKGGNNNNNNTRVATAELTKKVEALESKVDTLIAQIQMQL